MRLLPSDELDGSPPSPGPYLVFSLTRCTRARGKDALRFQLMVVLALAADSTGFARSLMISQRELGGSRVGEMPRMSHVIFSSAALHFDRES
jgi:hypothetical protein